MSEETHAEQIARVEMMAQGDATWDLSENDMVALTAVLTDRSELLKALQNLMYCEMRISPPPYDHKCMWCGHCIQRAKNDARIAIGEAEGKRMRIALDLPRYES